MIDVIVIGGGYAGMAAALQLLRARRSVLILDAGERRNRFARHSHGFLTQDGEDPAVIAARARAELERYNPDLFQADRALQVTGNKDNFTVLTESGARFAARRVILATGVRDSLPDLPGLAERWGQSVFHCPYCHGFELAMGPIGLLANGPEALRHVPLFADFGQATLLTNDAFPLDPETRARLGDLGLGLDERRVTGLDGPLDGPVEIHFANGASRRLNGLFVQTRTSPASDLGETIGLALQDTPLGSQYRTSETKETSQAGIYACGDVARAPHSVSLAVGDGAWAGMQVHRSLVFDPIP